MADSLQCCSSSKEEAFTLFVALATVMSSNAHGGLGVLSWGHNAILKNDFNNKQKYGNKSNPTRSVDLAGTAKQVRSTQ